MAVVPRGPDQEENLLIEVSVTKETTERKPKRGSCAGCGCTDRALMVPERGISRGYDGPMFCMGCNPRFVGGGPEARLFLSV